MGVQTVEKGMRYRILAVCSTFHALNHSYINILPPAIPIIIAEFNLTYGSAGLLMTTFLLLYAFFQLPAGYLTDKVFWTSLLIPGIILSAIGIALTTWVKNFLGLLVAMVISGLGGGTYHPVGISLIGNIFRKEDRGRALGVHGFAASSGFFVTPFVLGLLYSYGWRFSFRVFAGLGVLIAGIAWILSKRIGKRGITKDTQKEGGKNQFFAGANKLCGTCYCNESDIRLLQQWSNIFHTHLP